MAKDKGTTTRTAFESARRTFVPKSGPATFKAEQHARKTGMLNPLVDPKGYGVIRRSLPRFTQREDGLWEMAVGTPMAIETRLDSTASMGDNVDVALEVLADMFELVLQMLPGYDPQIATGIFGDVSDLLFVICRPQFEMDADKIVEQLTLMVPERAGGDVPEDPHYGLFAAAYLLAAYIHRIGLKSYDFTISDAPGRDQLDEGQLIRIFGDQVFEKVAENGHQINAHNLPSTSEIVQDMLQYAHGFFLQVGNNSETTRFWTRIFGPERVVILPKTRLLPQVQAAIIGLTEGTLGLQNVAEFLAANNVSKTDAQHIIRSVANIPIGAQAVLPNFNKRPQKGDLFREKTDLWPIDPKELGKAKFDKKESKKGPKWF